MYAPLLFIHSWTRWLVLASAVYFLVRCCVGWLGKRSWCTQDNQFIWAFSQVLGYQVLFGLALYLSSNPYVKMAIAHPSTALGQPQVHFWVVRHGPTMLSALGVFHIGKARAKRSPADRRFRIYAVTFVLLVALIVSAIPWAGLSYGRPWFRWYF